MRSRRRPGFSASIWALLVVLAIVAGPLAATSLSASGGSGGGSALAGSGPDAGLRATIFRTAHGIPHIIADDFPGLGYGYGYALAQDNICVLADTYVTADGERSRYFGPHGSDFPGGHGSPEQNPNQGLFFPRIQGQAHNEPP